MKNPNRSQSNVATRLRNHAQNGAQSPEAQPKRSRRSVAHPTANPPKMGARREQTRSEAPRKAPAAASAAGKEEEEVKITLSGATLVAAATAAAHICVPLQQLLDVFAQDIGRQLRTRNQHERAGMLWDIIELLDYEDEAMRDQARRNLAQIQRAERLTWIKESLEQMEQVWPADEHAARAPRRVYRERNSGQYFTYVADPEQLVICSSAYALEFMSGAPLQMPCLTPTT